MRLSLALDPREIRSASSTRAQHAKDIDTVSAKIAEALRSLIAEHRAAVRGEVRLSVTALTGARKALLPALTLGTSAGIDRVSDLVEPSEEATGAVSDLTGALAYNLGEHLLQFLAQSGNTSDDADGMVDGWAQDAASNSINAGADVYLANSDGDYEKTWVADDDPCPDCADVDGETVAAKDDFSNDAPYGPIHERCGCTTEYAAAKGRRDGIATSDLRFVFPTDLGG